MTLTAHEAALTDRLLLLPDAQERLSAIVQRARHLPALAPADQCAANLVVGCVSAVWLVKHFQEGKCAFTTAADSPLVAGLVGCIAEVCTGADPAELANFQPTIFQRLGLWQSLSPTRQHGLTAVMDTIRTFAQSCL